MNEEETVWDHGSVPHCAVNKKRKGRQEMQSERRETSPKESLSYAALGLGKSLCSQAVGFYLLFFYTDVLSIPAKVITVLFLLSNIWDAVNDQLAGYIICKTRSRHGNLRPYLLWTAFPMAICSIALFFTPNVSLTLKIVYAYVVYFLWDTVNTFLSISIYSLLPLMCKSDKEGTKNNSYLMMATVFSVLIVSTFTLPLANWLGGGSLNMKEQGSYQSGFPLAMLLFGVIAIPFQLLGFKNVKERYAVSNKKTIAFKTTFQCFMEDKTILLFFFIFFLTTMANTFKNQSSAYYISYVLKQPGSISLFFFTGIGASLLMHFFMRRLTQIAGVTRAVFFGMIGSLLSLAIMLFSRHSLTITICGNTLFGLASAIPANLVYVMLAGYIDKYNNNPENKGNISAWFYATLSFGTKVGAGIAGSICSGILAYVHYKPGEAASPLAEKGITFNFLGGTILAYALALLFMFILRIKISGSLFPVLPRKSQKTAALPKGN